MHHRLATFKSLVVLDMPVENFLISIRGAIRPTDPSGVPLASGAPAPSSGVIQTLSNILRNRYNPDVKFLNLESLGSDPMMLSDPALSGFGTDSLETSKLGPVICKMIGQQFPDVLTISFKSNHLTSLRPFQTLPNHVPLIQNLSFHDN
ncbi:hypothetical protein BC829DRAFT_242187 [Chytridium lagenaria]|nr:hypothetical protein BC829DRAFT_242187 [Chytridium lagenaria]